MSGLRWKLFLSYLLVCFIPLVFYANTISNSMERYFTDKKSAELIRDGNIASLLAADMLTDAANLPVPQQSPYREYFKDYCSQWNVTRIMVLDSLASVELDTSAANNKENLKMYTIAEVRNALDNKSVSNLQPKANPDDVAEMYAAVPVLAKSPDSGESVVVGAVLLIADVNEINEIISQITQKLALIAALLAIIVLTLVFFISQLFIDPLKNLLDVVNKMTEGHWHQRITIPGHDEFSELSKAFNEMSGKLEQVETTRAEFVSNVSHELKTPLSSIKVLSESLLMQDGAPEQTYREFLTDITSEVDRMANIVNDLLSLVRLDQMEQPLNIAPVSVTKTLEEVIKRLAPLAAKKNISLRYEETRAFTINADEMKLSLAFANLVENGIKYTPDFGFVETRVDGDHQNVFITITDSGIGIAEEEREKIFERFYRVDKTRDRETGGTGLGLAIVQKIVLLHEGSVKVISSENEGSSFIVRLPIK